MSPRWPEPDVLARIPSDRHVVVEASAGTGKTFTIESVVLRSVLAGEPIERVLVLTFGEAAAHELRRRIRGLLERVLAVAAGGPQPDVPPGARAFSLGPEELGRLEAALAAFERAPISTIHAFCQRVLFEHAFEDGLLFEQRIAPGDDAVAKAVRSALRRGIARDDKLAADVRRWLADGTIAGLEQLVIRARRLRHPAVRRHLGIDDGEARASFDRFLAGLAGALTDEQLELEVGALPLQAHERDLLAHAVEQARSPSRVGALDRLASLVGLGDQRFGPLAAGAPRKLRRVLLAALQRAELPAGGRSQGAELLDRVLPLALGELELARAAGGALDFDDLLFELARALSGARGDVLGARVAARFDRALVDEFQDTDDVQWRIFQRLFVAQAGGPRLLVVGDPKQAIYAFRGADVFTYVEATTELEGEAGQGAATVSLTHSFRSSPELLRAVDLALGREGETPLLEGLIELRSEVLAGGDASIGAELGGAPAAPVVLLRVDGADDGSPLAAPSFQSLVAGAYADEVARLLAAEPVGALRIGKRGERRRLAPRDIFVLVRRSHEGRLVTAALRARGLRVDVAVEAEVHRSSEAREVRALLAALAEPESRTLALGALVTGFFAIPWESLGELRAAGRDHPAYARLGALAELAAERRFPELFHAMVHDTGLAARAAAAGSTTERAGVEHVLALLSAELEARDRSVAELAGLLSGWIAGTRSPPARSSELALRTPDAEDAVQVLTMHRSKGLEAAVVFVLPSTSAARADAVAVVHEGFRRSLVLEADQKEPLALAKLTRERSDEEQRLLYVALTRAKGRLYLPLVGEGALKRFGGAYVRLNERLSGLAARPDLGELFEVRPLRSGSSAGSGARLPRHPFEVPAEALEPLPRRARLPAAHGPMVVTSYSALKQLAPEPDLGRPRGPAGEVALGARALPRGAATGSFLHGLLERLSFAQVATIEEAAELAAEPSALELARAVARSEGVPLELAPHGLALAHAALRTPLPVHGAPRLVDLLHDKEVELLFPVPEGSHPDWESIGEACGERAFRAERGFVRGFVDLVVRVPEEDGASLWAVDYKSDLLERYDEDSMREHVERHYELQRFVYSVGVARLARLEPPAARPRFGGMLFVFLRGAPAGVLASPARSGEVYELERALSARIHHLDGRGAA